VRGQNPSAPSRPTTSLKNGTSMAITATRKDSVNILTEIMHLEHTWITTHMSSHKWCLQRSFHTERITGVDTHRHKAHAASVKRSGSRQTPDIHAYGKHTCGEADIQGSPDQPEQSQPQST